MRILVINGPNLNLLGLREPALYGRATYADLLSLLQTWAGELDVTVDCVQSNHEGALVDAVQSALGRYDALILNPAAYTHTSVALLDAVLAVGLPTVEVHLTDPDLREPFRRVSHIRSACAATVKGMGLEGYREALRLLARGLTGRG